jgi:hypothetical protein
VVWSYATEFLNMNFGTDYIFVATKWLDKKKFEVVNIISTVVLRGIWLTRNALAFDSQGWSNVKFIMMKIWKLTMEWKVLCKVTTLEMMMEVVYFPGTSDQRPFEDYKQQSSKVGVSWPGFETWHLHGLQRRPGIFSPFKKKTLLKGDFGWS